MTCTVRPRSVSASGAGRTMPVMGMMKCTRSLIYHCPIQGELRFVPGRSQASEDSPYVVEHPEHFKVAAEGQRGARSRTRDDVIRVTSAPRGWPAQTAAAPRRRPHRERPWRLAPITDQCGLRDGTAQTRVRVQPGARHVWQAIADKTTGRDQLEVGCLLAGRLSSQLAEIVAIGPPGPGAARTPTSYRGDVDWDLWLLDELREQLPELEAIGQAHTHPGEPDPVPSRSDLRAWAAGRRALNLREFVGVILTPNYGDGWDEHFYIVEEGHGRDICRRAQLTGGRPALRLVRSSGGPSSNGKPSPEDVARSPGHEIDDVLHQLAHAAVHHQAAIAAGKKADYPSCTWNLSHAQHHADLALTSAKKLGAHLAQHDSKAAIVKQQLAALSKERKPAPKPKAAPPANKSVPPRAA